MKNTPENYMRLSTAVMAALKRASEYKSKDPEVLRRWTHDAIMSAVHPVVTAPEGDPSHAELQKRGQLIASAFRLKLSPKSGYYLTAFGRMSAEEVFVSTRNIIEGIQ